MIRPAASIACAGACVPYKSWMAPFTIFSTSALPLRHCFHPYGHIGGSAALGHGPITVQADLLANGDCALAVLGMVDANCSKRVVHCPLHLRHRLRHLFLD